MIEHTCDSFRFFILFPVYFGGKGTVAQELGICIDTLRSWLKAAGVQMGQADRQNRNARRERELEAEVRALRKKLAEKDEVIELLKKSIGIISKP